MDDRLDRMADNIREIARAMDRLLVRTSCSRKLLNEDSTPNRILYVSVQQPLWPITEATLREVFTRTGNVEPILMVSSFTVDAVVQYESSPGAITAWDKFHNRHIYDGCCLMDVQFASIDHIPLLSFLVAKNAPHTTCSTFWQTRHRESSPVLLVTITQEMPLMGEEDIEKVLSVKGIVKLVILCEFPVVKVLVQFVDHLSALVAKLSMGARNRGNGACKLDAQFSLLKTVEHEARRAELVPSAAGRAGLPKEENIPAGSTPRVEQLSAGVANVSLGSDEGRQWEILSRRPSNKGGSSSSNPWVNNQKVWGPPDVVQKMGFHAVPQPEIAPPLPGGWNWKGRPAASLFEGGNESNKVHLIDKAANDDRDNDDDPKAVDSDDELLGDDFDSDESVKSHDTRKQSRGFKGFFKSLEDLCPIRKAPVSGFSLPYDGSSSSLLDSRHSFSDQGSPTSPPLEDPKSLMQGGRSPHQNGMLVDSRFPNSPSGKNPHENFFNELNLFANSGRMCIEDRLPIDWNDVWLYDQMRAANRRNSEGYGGAYGDCQRGHSTYASSLTSNLITPMGLEGEILSALSRLQDKLRLGYIHFLAKDQQGCRFLQKIFEEGNLESIRKIFEEIIYHVVELMLDPFGNYRMQKWIETIKSRQRQQIELVIASREPAFLALIKDLNGSHVVQGCLQCLSKKDTEFICVATARYCVDIITHQQGCCVLQRCISLSTGKFSDELIGQICASALMLAQDTCGNYVIQFIMEKKITHASYALIDEFKGNYVHLASQKFSSHVIEKCLAVFDDEMHSRVHDISSRVVHELRAASNFDQPLQDPHANYVIQAALRYTTCCWDDILESDKAMSLMVVEGKIREGRLVATIGYGGSPQAAVNWFRGPNPGGTHLEPLLTLIIEGNDLHKGGGM